MYSLFHFIYLHLSKIKNKWERIYGYNEISKFFLQDFKNRAKFKRDLICWLNSTNEIDIGEAVILLSRIPECFNPLKIDVSDATNASESIQILPGDISPPFHSCNEAKIIEGVELALASTSQKTLAELITISFSYARASSVSDVNSSWSRAAVLINAYVHENGPIEAFDPIIFDNVIETLLNFDNSQSLMITLKVLFEVSFGFVREARMV